MKSTLEPTDSEGRIDVVNDVPLTLDDLVAVVKLAEQMERQLEVWR